MVMRPDGLAENILATVTFAGVHMTFFYIPISVCAEELRKIIFFSSSGFETSNIKSIIIKVGVISENKYSYLT